MSDDESDQEFFESEQGQEEEENFNYYSSSQPSAKINDDVIEEDIDPSDAFAKFVGTYHDTSNNDFTGKISKGTAPKTIDIFQPTPAYEAPVTKYNRLLAELKVFKEELVDLCELDGVSTIASKLKKEVGSLEGTIKPLKLSKKYAPFLNPNFPTKEDQLHTKGAVSALRKKISTHSSKKIIPPREEKIEGLCYEFYQAKPLKAKTAKSISTLEKRLDALEKTIGKGDKTIFPDIRTTIIYVGKKMDSLNAKQLKDLQTKMDYLSRELKNLEKKKEKLASSKKSAYQTKVRDLYSKMGKWDEASHTVPIIKRRLESIQSVVVAGKDSKKQMKAVVTEKNNVALFLDKDVALLKKCTTDFKKSLQEVKQVVELEKSFEELTKKMQKHFG